MIKACIFDLDGTLLNTLEDLTDAVNYALTRHHFPERSLEEVRRFLGNGVAVLMQRAVPCGTTQEETEACLADFKSYYELHKQDKTDMYDGIAPVLAELCRRGIRIAIVSNKFDQAVKELNQFYFSDWIQVAIGESAGVSRKPAPDTVYKAIEELQVEKDEVLYIGDSETDVMTAANAGVAFVGVTWGFRDRETLIRQGASRLIDTPKTLLELLA